MLKTSVKTNTFSFKCSELKHFNWIFKYAACFPMNSKNIKVITSPSQFYNTLLERCQTATQRISIASLYIGTGHLEKGLLQIINENLDQNDNVKFQALIDYQRGTRGELNSKKLLQKVINSKPKQCSIAMYHTPNLKGLYKALLPPRWNELIGLQHMKVYVIDNTVILTGANCSNDYFTNRQDRYIEIEDGNLANFYFGLLEIVKEFSVQCKENLVEIKPNFDDRESFIQTAHDKVLAYLDHWNKQQSKAQYEISDNVDTWVFPLVQMGELKITQDSTVTDRILSSAPSNSMLRLATGYFNLTNKYADTIVNKSKSKFSLLMAHPNANGFLGAKGVAGGIPYAYSLIARKFYELVAQANQQNRITLLEYERPGWTFHGKGIWYYPPASVLPWGTVIGSANLGERSVSRDLESQIVLFTESKVLQEQLHNECSRLHSYSQECSKDLLERRIPLWVQLAVNMFRNFF